MKDIPLFATELGVASLTLQQIPYTGCAYIKIQSSADSTEFLRECVAFCKAAGGQKIYASGHECLCRFAQRTEIWQMRAEIPQIDNTDCLFPVQEHTLDQWLQIYNDRMKDVTNASCLTKSRAKQFVEAGSAYYVHAEGVLLGIGIAADNKIQAIVSCQKGAGERVFKTLCRALTGESVCVEVASNNVPAIRLYEKLGFLKTSVLSTWFDVTNV